MRFCLQSVNWLLARIAASPDATVRALRAELAERGTKVSNDAVWRFLRNARLTFRKKALGRPSWIGLTSLASVNDGSDIRAGSIPIA